MGQSDTAQILVGGIGDIMGVIFFTMPMIQVIQLFKGQLKAADVSYLVFIVNGTMSIFFASDFFRVKDIFALVPNSYSVPINLFYFIVYCLYMYAAPQCFVWIAVAIVYVSVLLSLALFVLPLWVVVDIAVILNVMVGLATLQKFVSPYSPARIVLRAADIRLQGDADSAEHIRAVQQRVLAGIRGIVRTD